MSDVECGMGDDLLQGVEQFQNRGFTAGCNLKNFTRRICRVGQQDRIDQIVHKNKVASLLAVAVNYKRFPLKNVLKVLRHNAAFVVRVWSVYVGETQSDCVQTKRPVERRTVSFTSELAGAV